MPGVPLVVCETTCRSFGWNCNSRIADQMCRQQSHAHLSAEEALEAEESLSVYCKPVELYNILHRRAIKNPSLLRRCLHYMLEAKRKKRIQITVSLSRTLNTEVEPEGLFPLYVLLARPVDIKDSEHSSVYRLSRASVLITFSELGKKTETEANFIIPEIKKLTSDVRVGNLTIILVRHGKTKGADENYLPKDLDEVSSFLSKLEGNCFWGKLHLKSFHSSMEKHVTLSLGHTTEMLSTFNMHPCSLEPSCLDQNCLTFRPHNSDLVSSYQVQVNLSAREIGERESSPYDSYTYHDVPRTSLPHIIRLRTGNVLFNYRYYNNKLQKTEVTEDFSCPFCLMKCASFKGLRYHLISSHDLFNFEFWVTEEFQAVNVSVRTDIWRSEVVPDVADPRLQTIFYRSKFRRRRRSKNLVQNVNHAHPHILSSDSPELDREGSCEDCLKDNVANSSHRRITYPSDAGLSNGLNGSCSDKEDRSSKILLDETHSLSGRHKLESSSSEIHLTMESKEPVTSSPDDADVCLTDDYTPTTMLQFAKTRKLSIERADPRNRLLLQKRQFFHSHRAQPMALEQVFSDRDSEDEVDDDIADFEDRKMLDDFVDVTTIEKQMMHLWNSFVRKQRVLADGHIPWSCEAFSQLHGKDLVQAPALLRCWRLFMVKLWNHSLLDARSMNNCNLILERSQNESSDPKQS